MGERVKLTKRLLDSVVRPASGETRLWDSDAKGFVARIFHNGRVSFGVKLRIGSLQRWMTIGDLGSPWTVEQARERARYMLADAFDGIDPQLEKQEARAALTVAALIERYLSEGRMSKPNKRESSWANDASLLRRHAIPLIGKRDANAIDQLAVVMAPESVAEVVIVRAYRRTVTRGGGGSNWNWNDTNGGQNNNGGGGTEETWTPIAETNTYATRSNYYCNLHNTPTIGTKKKLFCGCKPRHEILFGS